MALDAKVVIILVNSLSQSVIKLLVFCESAYEISEKLKGIYGYGYTEESEETDFGDEEENNTGKENAETLFYTNIQEEESEESSSTEENMDGEVEEHPAEEKWREERGNRSEEELQETEIIQDTQEDQENNSAEIQNEEDVNGCPEVRCESGQELSKKDGRKGTSVFETREMSTEEVALGNYLNRNHKPRFRGREKDGEEFQNERQNTRNFETERSLDVIVLKMKTKTQNKEEAEKQWEPMVLNVLMDKAKWSRAKRKIVQLQLLRRYKFRRKFFMASIVFGILRCIYDSFGNNQCNHWKLKKLTEVNLKWEC